MRVQAGFGQIVLALVPLITMLLALLVLAGVYFGALPPSTGCGDQPERSLTAQRS